MRNRKIVRKYDHVDRHDLEQGESVFHTANGYIGVRGAFEEGYCCDVRSVRGCYINGVYDITSMSQAEALYGLVDKKQTIVNLAEVQDIRIWADGELVTVCGAYERTADLDCGTVSRAFTFFLKDGSSVSLVYERFCSFVLPGVFALRCRVTGSSRHDFTVVTGHHSKVSNFHDSFDPRLASEAGDFLSIVETVIKGDSISLVKVRTNTSGIEVSSAVHDSISSAAMSLFVNDDVAERKFSISNEKGFTFTRLVSFADSVRCRDTDQAALDELQSALSLTYDGLAEKQKKYMSDFWHRTGFFLEGDDRLESAINYNLFSLLQSAGRDGFCHLAAKGLSGEGYEGHYFWDTEMYVQPIFSLIMPSLSRNLLTYRYRMLDKARANARILGHESGALYPWRTINGEECSGYFPSGTAQYHINGAVAHAVIEYYEMSGDEDFMISMGLEMLYEICLLWLDTGVYTPRGFEIHDVTGPDEYTCIVNNNFYTNCCARYDFEKTAALMKDFTGRGKHLSFNYSDEMLDEFVKAAGQIYLPHDDEKDVDAQDDSFLYKKRLDLSGVPHDKRPMLLHYHPLYLYRRQVCKQADTVLAHLLYPQYTTRERMLNSIRYYESVTTHDSSLSKCIFALQSFALGLVDEGLSYFGSSSEIDLEDSHGNTRDGIHTANMGGSYLTIFKGLGGFCIQDGLPSFAPILPSRLKSYGFNVNFRGNVITVNVNGKGASFTSEKPCEILVYGVKENTVQDM